MIFGRASRDSIDPAIVRCLDSKQVIAGTYGGRGQIPIIVKHTPVRRIDDRTLLKSRHFAALRETRIIDYALETSLEKKYTTLNRRF